LVYRIRKWEEAHIGVVKTPIVILTMIDKEASPYLIENRISAYLEKCCEPEIIAEVLENILYP